LQILVLSKRQYNNKDLIDDSFGRIRELSLELALKGHKVLGLCLSYAKKEEGILFDGSVEWQSFNTETWLIPGLWRYFRRASDYAKSVDIIWACSDSIYGIIGYMLSARYSTPLVLDLYDNFEFFLAAKLPIVKQLYHHAIKHCSAVTCVSRPLADLINSYGRKENVVVLENAVRNDLFFPMDKKSCRASLKLPPNSQLIGTAGSLKDNRGIGSLYGAFELLKDRYPDLHLVLAGPRKGNLPRVDRIHDLGILPLEKVPLLLNALDVAVICNRNSEFGKYCYPQKAVEIMACDVPLIAARVGSMARLFKDRPEWLFTPDSHQDLAAALERRLAHRDTNYTNVPSWKNAADRLEDLMFRCFLRDRR
jgi:teichuronic acid biosynthesis glycosyltransferase TuaC